MRTLIIVRHGSYDSDGLTLPGCAQLADVRDAILPDLKDRTVAVLTSNAPRAMLSGSIIASAIGVTIIADPALYSDDETAYDLAHILALAIRHGMDADVVILVTHYEIVADLPAYVGRNFGIASVPRRTLSRGKGILLDLEEKTFRNVP